MRSYAVDYGGAGPAGSGYMEVEPVNAEAAEVFGVAHAIDRDNLTASLGSAKLAIGAMGGFHFGSRADLDAVSVPVGIAVPIPDDDGNPWRAEFTTKDGWIEFEVYVAIASLPNRTSLALLARLDGVVVARSPGSRPAARNGPLASVSERAAATLSTGWAGPVKDGPHLLEFLLTRSGGGKGGAGMGDGPALSPADVEHGEWFVAEVLR